MKDNEFLCDSCESEFSMIHEGNDIPMFCPFCGEKLTYNDLELGEEWDEDDRDRGC
jgi:predicted amidophosphoribosyltransferase